MRGPPCVGASPFSEPGSRAAADACEQDVELRCKPVEHRTGDETDDQGDIDHGMARRIPDRDKKIDGRQKEQAARDKSAETLPRSGRRRPPAPYWSSTSVIPKPAKNTIAPLARHRWHPLHRQNPRGDRDEMREEQQEPGGRLRRAHFRHQRRHHRHQPDGGQRYRYKCCQRDWRRREWS